MKKPAGEGKAIEEALAPEAVAERYLLRLFVAGTTARSMRAIGNIRAICEQNLPDRYDLEVIDIYRHPEMAQPAQIVVAPTLIKYLPLPVRRIPGDLSQTKRVTGRLEIVPAARRGRKPGGP